MQEAAAARRPGRADEDVRLVLVGFSPAPRLQAIARHLGWTGLVLSDEPRELYGRLGIGRAPLWRVYNPGTLATYARDLLPGGQRRTRPVAGGEDTRQLGGDAISVEGTVRLVWRPRSPDDRPPAAEVLAGVDEATAS